MVSAQGLALAAAAAGAAMMAWSVAARRLDVHERGELRLPWLAAGTLAASAVVLAMGWRAAQGAPGLFGSRLGHLALALAGILLLACVGAAWLHSRRNDVPAASLSAWRRGVAIAMAALALLVWVLAMSVWRQPAETLALVEWPFAWRYEPDLPVSPHTWNRLWLALAQSAVALALFVSVLFVRRWRLPLLAASAALAAATSWPHPRMMLTEAHATTYQRSPLVFSDANVLQGGRLYRQHCASCHGSTADGRGPRAASLTVWPSVLGPALFENRLEGELYWRLTQDGRTGAAAQSHEIHAGLRPDEAWRVLDYLRLLAYGASGGAGMPAVPAPVVDLACRDGRATRLNGLRGLPLRIVAHVQGAADEPQDPRLLTVALTRGRADDVSADCVATDATAWDAFALAAGVSPDSLAGAQFMVDRKGWLRARRLPGTTPAWTSADNVCGPSGRMENTSARGLGNLLLAMDRAPVAMADLRRDR
ncbi:cytochrome c [Achromobacter sp.]|uniref:c-type cytochrome n=1 Tax=Achromobacter sp. TaxID=134375 RepID=UPI0028A5A243|nr:cytochrome c [Achromobacter sp.]